MAMENASSPVEHPAIHTRMGSSLDLFLNMTGNTVSRNTLKALGSRKKEVTGISTSRKSASCSALSVRRNFK